MSFKRWTFAPMDKDFAAALAEECGLHPFLALMLSIRGVKDAAGAENFLLGGELQDDPFGFADMDAAVERIEQALDRHERIAVFGDYDADGVTATVLLYSYLKERGADVIWRIPKREGDGEGYGLRPGTVDILQKQDVRLIVTVDNGITSLDAVAHANELGIDVVVTDHHQPQGDLPAAVAVVDPHRADCESTFKDYAGVGVAWKLVCALEGDADIPLQKYADLVAVGTLADVMRITGENRVLVREGIRLLNENERLGFRVLSEVAGIQGKTKNSSMALFSLAPRINAAGRMGSPELAAELLLTEDEQEATALAEQIQSLNARRQEVEGTIIGEVDTYLQEHPECLRDRVIVVDGGDWFSGVVGIIAARILERYGKPCIILSRDGDVAHGSGRSIHGFSLFDALTACGDLLLTYGGHELAAGVSLSAENIDEFRRRINQYAAETYPVMPVPELRLDFKIRPNQIDTDKLQLIAALEPFGNGNPSPVFQLSDMRLENVTPVGGGKHLRLSLSRDGAMLSAMKFQTAPEAFPIPCGSLLHLAVSIDRNEYRGVVSPSIIIKDIRFADTDQEALLADRATADGILRGEVPADVAACIPTRAQFSAVYRLIRAGGFTGSIEQLHHLVGEDIGYAALSVALEALRQADLIRLHDSGDLLEIAVLPASEKVQLNDTPIMRFLLDHTKEGILP